MPDFLLCWGRGRETGGVFLSSFCLTAFVYSPLIKPMNVSKQRYRPVTRYTSQSSVLRNHFPFALGQSMSVLNPFCSSYSHQLSCSFASLALWVSTYFLGENFPEELMRDEGLKWVVCPEGCCWCCCDKVQEYFSFKWSWLGNSIPLLPFKSKWCPVFLALSHGSKSWIYNGTVLRVLNVCTNVHSTFLPGKLGYIS